MNLKTAGLSILGLLLAACYTLTPAGGVAPAVGTKVAFDVNDAGRVALGGQMGPEIAQIEGQLVERDGETYLVAVSTVRLLRGGEQVWSGEQVRLKSEYVGSTYERKLSKGRSIALGVAGIGGFGVLLATRSLLGGGTKDSNRPPDDTTVTSLGRP